MTAFLLKICVSALISGSSPPLLTFILCVGTQLTLYQRLYFSQGSRLELTRPLSQSTSRRFYNLNYARRYYSVFYYIEFIGLPFNQYYSFGSASSAAVILSAVIVVRLVSASVASTKPELRAVSALDVIVPFKIPASQIV